MKLTIQNLTSSVVSTELANLAPCETRSFNLTSEEVYRAGALLKSLEDAGKISTSVADESVSLNKYAAVTPANDVIPTDDVTLYVDQATGLDTNDGSASRPLKTINAALSKVPLVLYANTTINVGAGIYAESLAIRCIVINVTSKVLTIQGTSWIPPTISTGVLSGTFTSVGSWTITKTSAGWTSNELKGSFVKMASGANSGTLYPIAGNTSDTIDIALKTTTALNGCTFEIVTPGAIITKDATDNRSARVWSTVLGSSSASVNFIGLDFASGSVGGVYLMGASGLLARNCKFKATTAPFYGYAGSSAIMQNCAFIGTGISIGLIVVGSSGYCSLSKCTVDGPIGSASGVSNREGAISDCIIQNGTAGASGFGTTFTSSISNTLIRNQIGGGRGVQCGMNTIWISGCKITNCSTGILVYASKASLILSGSDITNCLIDAISCSDAHITLTISASNLTGNVRYAVNMADTPTANQHGGRYGACRILSTVAMSGNGGDLSLDGSSSSTVAALREVVGPPAKTIVNTTNHNEIFEV